MIVIVVMVVMAGDMVKKIFDRCLKDYFTPLYLIVILSVIPLYYRHNLYYIGSVKHALLNTASIVAFIFLIVFLIINLKDTRSFLKNIKLSSTDRLVICFFICSLLSFVFSIDKNIAFYGYNDWFLGFRSLSWFCLLYLFASRFLTLKNIPYIIGTMLLSAFFVGLLGIFHRFKFDPLNLISAFEQPLLEKFIYISTIGHVDHFESYLSLYLPLSFAFIFSFHIFSDFKTANGFLKYYKLIGGLCVSASMLAASFICGTESIIVTLLIIAVILFFMGISIPLMITCAITMTALHFALLYIPSYSVLSITDSITLSAGWCIFLVLVLIVTGLKVKGRPIVPIENSENSIEYLRKKFSILYILLIAAILLFVVYILFQPIYLVNFLSRYLPNSIVVFNDAWGTFRGLIWRSAFKTYGDFDFLHKLFGAGLDCFNSAVYSAHKSALNKIFISAEVINAHNEYINTLVNQGLLGLVSYLGIFISAVIRFTSNIRKSKLLFCLYVTLPAYMIFNIFSFSNLTVTATAFALIGMGEGVVRNGSQVVCHKSNFL